MRRFINEIGLPCPRLTLRALTTHSFTLATYSLTVFALIASWLVIIETFTPLFVHNRQKHFGLQIGRFQLLHVNTPAENQLPSDNTPYTLGIQA